MSSVEMQQTIRRFEGFQNTPILWDDALYGLKIYTANQSDCKEYPNIDTTAHIRLGKLIEQFVLFELQQDVSIELLASNIQVFRNKVTIGELDCLIQQDETHIHLEIVYKFYLYDPNISGELKRWIGPNRNDSLVLKLNKLKEKQLPLLYEPEVVELLNGIDVAAIDQQVLFKAQLFVPFDISVASFPLINNDCIHGIYIRLQDLIHFQDHHFFIPSKLDWLVEPHLDVLWISVVDFKITISELLHKNKSPLCWMKSEDEVMRKLFVVWW